MQNLALSPLVTLELYNHVVANLDILLSFVGPILFCLQLLSVPLQLFNQSFITLPLPVILDIMHGIVGASLSVRMHRRCAACCYRSVVQNLV